MSDNWVVQNLENALETWNEKLSEIWTLITTTPQNFKGGNIWKVIVDINGAVQAIGLALLVLFFVIGMVKTCGSFTDVKKPEHALKLFVRFALAKGVITYGMELMLALFNIVQGTISTIMNAAGFGTPEQTTLPAEMVTTIEDCGFFESIPLWAVTLIGGLFITVLSFILIMTVYGRFFKLYMYTALAPIPLFNPFGAAKDIYIWEPIFKLLKANHIQLIVPARGATPAITARFDVNYILGQKMADNRQQTVVVDYYSNVKQQELEYTRMNYEQASFDFL